MTYLIENKRVCLQKTGSWASDNSAGVGCGRRLAKLYLVNRYFACRHCHQLVYVSKYEKQPWQRALRRANKLKQRFGADSNPVPASVMLRPALGLKTMLGATMLGATMLGLVVLILK